MKDYEGLGLFELMLDAIHERLARIEEHLGIEGDVPADVAVTALLDSEGEA